MSFSLLFRPIRTRKPVSYTHLDVYKRQAARPSSAALADRTGAFKLVVIEPKGFDECPKLVDNLKKMCIRDRFTMRDCSEPEKIAAAAAREAELKGYDVLIIDTAGRLQIDEALMDELVRIKAVTKPHEIDVYKRQLWHRL